MKINNTEIKVKRVHKLLNGKATKAFVDILINDAFLVKGLRIVDGKSGLFVSMPQEYSMKDNRWYDSVRVIDRDFKQYIADEVLEAYGKEEIFAEE